jgi:hypothetical protein
MCNFTAQVPRSNAYSSETCIHHRKKERKKG